MKQIKHIRLDKIKPPEFDSRITPSPQEDDELRDSIKELGILLPLLVKDIGDGYEIIAGNRRYREAGRAGLAAVPCEVLKVTGAQSDKIKLHENLKRLPLSHIDQGQTFAHLIKEYKMTETQVATLTGMSIAYVSQHLSLLACDDKLLQAVHDGRINFSVARELFLCKNPDERSHLQDVVEEHGASSTVVRSWVQESNRETDNFTQEQKDLNSIELPSETSQPLYPCSACNHAIPVPKIKFVRLCPECYFAIFSEIEHEKMKLRIKNATGTPEPPPGATISTSDDPNPV